MLQNWFNFQIFADWPMPHAKHMTKDNRKKKQEYHVIVLIRSLNTMIQSTCTANENANGLRRICKRSQQPKIERPENNDTGVIL